MKAFLTNPLTFENLNDDLIAKLYEHGSIEIKELKEGL
jgi:hypothetical protein